MSRIRCDINPKTFVVSIIERRRDSDHLMGHVMIGTNHEPTIYLCNPVEQKLTFNEIMIIMDNWNQMMEMNKNSNRVIPPSVNPGTETVRYVIHFQYDANLPSANHELTCLTKEELQKDVNALSKGFPHFKYYITEIRTTKFRHDSVKPL